MLIGTHLTWMIFNYFLQFVETEFLCSQTQVLEGLILRQRYSPEK
jgi:hypothetical protein